MQTQQPHTLGKIEFVILMAFISSITALSIDSILPALGLIALDFQLIDAKETQLIIVTLFFGMAFGQFIYGPMADSIGRKLSIYIGIGLFLIGSLFSIFANDLDTMLLGRFLQGLGAASPRIVTMAIVRDSYKGAKMASIMSLMMTIFIIIPIIAPALGALILHFSHWRMIYVATAIFSLIVLIWFALRQEETLKPEFKQAFSFKSILANSIEVLKYKTVVIYSIIGGLIFGGFLAYLSAAQHIFQNIYDTGNNFPFYFAALAVSLGLASYLNSKWVLIITPKKLVVVSLKLVILLNLVILIYIQFFNNLSLIQSMLYFIPLYFLVGLLFGNVNALAMEPIGHIAGIGAGIIGSLSTFISIYVGNTIGMAIDTNLYYFVLGFLVCSSVSLFLIYFLIDSNH